MEYEDKRYDFRDNEGNNIFERQEKRRIMGHLIFQMIGEDPFASGVEHQVWTQAHELEEHNALPDGVTAMDLYFEYGRIWGWTR